MSSEASSDAPEQPEESPRTAFLQALGVPRNGRVGAVVGVAFAVGVYLLFAVAPGDPGQRRGLLLVLAFVIAVSTAIIVTLVLTARNAARITADVPKWIRRGGTAGLLGGAAWVVAGLPAAGAAVGLAIPGGVAPVAGYLLPLPVLAVLCGAWAIHARNRHTGGYTGDPGETDVVGVLAFGLAATGLGVVAWIAAIEPAAYLGLPVDLSSSVFVGTHLVAALGTSLLGAGAINADGRLEAGPVALLLSLPASLAGVTMLAVLGGGIVVPTAFGVALGVPWVVMGRALRSGRGVPPVERFRPAFVATDPSTPGSDSAAGDGAAPAESGATGGTDAPPVEDDPG